MVIFFTKLRRGWFLFPFFHCQTKLGYFCQSHHLQKIEKCIYAVVGSTLWLRNRIYICSASRLSSRSRSSAELQLLADKKWQGALLPFLFLSWNMINYGIFVLQHEYEKIHDQNFEGIHPWTLGKTVSSSPDNSKGQLPYQRKDMNSFAWLDLLDLFA